MSYSVVSYLRILEFKSLGLILLDTNQTYSTILAVFYFRVISGSYEGRSYLESYLIVRISYFLRGFMFVIELCWYVFLGGYSLEYFVYVKVVMVIGNWGVCKVWDRVINLIMRNNANYISQLNNITKFSSIYIIYLFMSPTTITYLSVILLFTQCTIGNLSS